MPSFAKVRWSTGRTHERKDGPRHMSDGNDEGLRTRLTKQGEEAVGKLAQDLLDNPVISGALSRAFDVREKAAQAQEVAMGALNLPSASDLERLTRRVRSVAQRLEGIEDGLDRLEERLGSVNATTRLDERLTAIEQRLEALDAKLDAPGKPAKAPARNVAGDRKLKAIEDQLAALTVELHALRESLPSGRRTVSRSQESLKVG
jgi:chromosome segregation ATPase